jgi:hypothetical protein
VANHQTYSLPWETTSPFAVKTYMTEIKRKDGTQAHINDEIESIIGKIIHKIKGDQ